ncbi:hypothetical protein PTSG_05742 [Salpingoeca rosetta]|uniref:tRNA-intron lyase n=1 Tax=Salpingoeca rosetta (strain ATCC 50818 / BSB-021) TaxID=946362 RepID=F2UB36_SALR5|nr:uncharacterized protein PTSG_05742 [Salpingoeca rosetta]EGD74049.1 hypothetical protein PTSG_05742 [Salpingoeca rosetta]|eukprot:XP_004993611.1 hypothetical protein PTSG_05742 [Salpingoeca rosetta]
MMEEDNTQGADQAPKQQQQRAAADGSRKRRRRPPKKNPNAPTVRPSVLVHPGDCGPREALRQPKRKSGNNKKYLKVLPTGMKTVTAATWRSNNNLPSLPDGVEEPSPYYTYEGVFDGHGVKVHRVPDMYWLHYQGCFGKANLSKSEPMHHKVVRDVAAGVVELLTVAERRVDRKQRRVERNERRKQVRAKKREEQQAKKREEKAMRRRERKEAHKQQAHGGNGGNGDDVDGDGGDAESRRASVEERDKEDGVENDEAEGGDQGEGAEGGREAATTTSTDKAGDDGDGDDDDGGEQDTAAPAEEERQDEQQGMEEAEEQQQQQVGGGGTAQPTTTTMSAATAAERDHDDDGNLPSKRAKQPQQQDRTRDGGNDGGDEQPQHQQPQQQQQESSMQWVEVSGDNIPPELRGRQIIHATREVLQLSLVEAFFLKHGLGCLRILDEAGRDMSTVECWRAFTRVQPQFVQRYVVYHHLRSAGWVPKSGLKFAADFLAYRQGPAYYHSRGMDVYSG